MLMSIRDRTHGWIATIIVSLLILSFALWGIHSYLVGGSVNSYVAKVNGVEITKQQLAASYERLLRQTQMQSNAELSSTSEKNLKLRALQELIDTQVLKQASLKQDYRISSQQIDGFLESMPQFQVNGQFSLARFQQAMAMTMYSTMDFLDLIKTTLLINQPRLGTIFTSFTLPNEVEEAVALVNQERDIQYAALSSQMIKQPVSISEDQIQAYYKSHAADYQTLEQVSVEYLELRIADLEKNVHSSMQELKNYYDENTTSFALPSKDKQKKPEIPSFEKVKDKVAAVLARQKAEEQFANIREKLANLTYEHPDSLKPAAAELGLPIKTSDSFTKEKAGKEIASNAKIREAAFSNDVLNLQNNSDVIQTGPDSIAVIRIKSHVPSALLALNVVQKEITAKLQAIEINHQLEQLASKIQQQLQTASNPEQVLQTYHLRWNELGMIGRHAAKIDSAILDTAFAMPKPEGDKKISYAITKIPNGYAVIGVKAIREGKLNNQDEYRVFAEQIQNTQGLLEYQLYKDSLMKQAKIVTG